VSVRSGGRIDLARNPEAVATALLLITVAIWGSMAEVTSIGSAYAQPLTLTALRAVPTPLVLLLALPLLRFRMPRGATAWIFTAIGGLLMVDVFLGGFTEAVIRAGPGPAIVLASTSPFWVAILGRLVYGERVSLRTTAGLVIGFAGVILVFSSQLGSHAGAGRTATGLLFALAAALGWAVGTLVVKAQLTRAPDSDLVGIVAGQYLIGGAVMAAIALGVEGGGGARWSSPDLWLAVAYISVVGSAIATVIYFAALRMTSATRATAWAFLSPVVAILIAIGLGSVPAPAVFAGMAITIVGVCIVNLPDRAAGEETAPAAAARGPALAPLDPRAFAQESESEPAPLRP
jgi:probable blue pigment (indigoidine) exporter